MDAYLGVDHSLTGRRWVGPAPEIERACEVLEQQTGLPRAVCSILARRSVPVEEVTGFLEPKLRELLPDPRRMKDMDAA
ncbi:single-stranded-DNA-specific exonuclease RecJ, partial [Cribrihabitans sp. XS_ASV171]